MRRYPAALALIALEHRDQLAARTRSEVAQVLGNTVLLYRAHPEDPTIVLPG